METYKKAMEKALQRFNKKLFLDEINKRFKDENVYEKAATLANNRCTRNNEKV